MKKNKLIKKISLAFFLLSLFFISEAVAQDKLHFDSKYQKVEFFIDDDILMAKIYVEERITSKSALTQNYGKTLFYNDESYIDKIKLKANGRNKKVKPIISDYESNGIFSSDTKISYFDYNFTEEGETILIKYTKVFEDVKYIDKLFFNERYEVTESTIDIVVPDWLELNVVEWNFDSSITKKPAKGKTPLRYELDNVPKAYKYKDEPSINKTCAHLILIVESYKHKNRPTVLLKETGDLYNWYAGLVKDIGNDNNTLKPLVTKLTANETDPKEKVKNIFYWVQDNIRYLAFEDGIMGFKPESCQKVLGNKYGDCKGMANLTKEMLILAGFDARLTWIGTNDLPYDYSIPSLVVDNHMICMVILDNKEYFLDATEKYADFDNYAYRIQGKDALVENGESYSVKKIPVSKLENNKRQSIHKLAIDGEQLVGSGTTSFSGNRKTTIYNYLASMPQGDRNEFMTNFVRNSDKNVSVTVDQDIDELVRDSDFKIGYDISIENKILSIGDELYINPEIDFEFKKYFTEKDRDRAMDIGSSYLIQKNIELTIPEEYTINYIPESLNIRNGKYEMILEYVQEGSTLNYSKEIRIIDPNIGIDELKEWDSSIEKLNTFYSDQIVLIKK